MSYFNSFLWKNLLEFEIELLEDDKKQLLEKLDSINMQIHKKYQQLANLDNIVSVKVSFKDILKALKDITNDEDLSLKIYALSSFFRGDNEKEIEDSSNTMNFIGSELAIFSKDKSIVYSHLHLFNHLYDSQLDGKCLLEHCSIYHRDSFQDLIVDDVDQVIGTFYLNQISPSENARTNDYDCLLEQAIFNCIISDKVIEYQKKGNQKTK